MATHFTSGLAVGSNASASELTLVKKGTISVNLPSIADGDVGEVTLTITGAAVGDIVVLCPAAAGLTAGLALCEARVSAANEVKVRAVNGSGGAVDEAAQTMSYLLIR